MAISRSSEIHRDSPQASKHIPALDGLRGLAILMVMAFHFSLPNWSDDSNIARMVAQVAGMGSSGVNLFFVLSGFLITGILYEARSGKHYFRNFYMRRVLRIFPLYYGTLFVLLVAIPLIRMPSDGNYQYTVQHQFWLWTYCSNIYEAIADRAFPLFGHFWSLAVEEHFYFLWPIVVLLCRRKTLMRIALGCLAVAFCVRLGLLYAGANPWVAVYRLTPCQIDSIAIGAFLALFVKGGGDLRQLVTPARLTVALWVLVLASRLWIFPDLAWDNYFVQSALYSGWALAFGGLLILTLVAPRTSFLSAVFTNRTLRLVGKYSYAIYVFHWFIGKALLALYEILKTRYPSILNMPGPLLQLIYFSAGVLLSFLAAWASWHLYEKHFLKLKRYFQHNQPPTAIPAENLANVSVTPTTSTF